jgi:hypothetical protein
MGVGHCPWERSMFWRDCYTGHLAPCQAPRTRELARDLPLLPVGAGLLSVRVQSRGGVADPAGGPEALLTGSAADTKESGTGGLLPKTWMKEYETPGQPMAVGVFRLSRQPTDLEATSRTTHAEANTMATRLGAIFRLTAHS